LLNCRATDEQDRCKSYPIDFDGTVNRIS